MPIPVFLISLPRSGSTLLQRMLMGHSEIASHAEPWFLLPLLYGLKSKGIGSDYGHKSAIIAMRNLYNSLGGAHVYESELAKCALNIYEGLAGGKRYFIDKTPRYYLIASDLFRIFPTAKFIVLLRNPLSVLASNIEAFKGGNIRRLDHLDRDLYLGPQKLEEFVTTFGHRNNVQLINYDDLITDPNNCLKELLGFLDLEFEECTLSDFSSQKLTGYGDHLGSKKYDTVKNQSEKWKTILSTPVRKYIARRYISDLSEEYFELLNLECSTLLDQLQKQEVLSAAVAEYFYLLESALIRWTKTRLNYKALT